MVFRSFIVGILLVAFVTSVQASEREKYNFNSDWCLKVGELYVSMMRIGRK